MRPAITQDQSTELKIKFKNHFRDCGYNAALPFELETKRKKYPVEWAEACQEFEQWGWQKESTNASS